MKKAFATLFVCLFVSTAAFGAVFVVPDDTELIQKSSAIVTGRVVSSQARTTADGVETVYTVRVDRSIKGMAAGTINVVSPGGVSGHRFTAVSGAAHFNAGDDVLLFLVLHRGNWTTTDMTLGKFRFLTSTGGQSLLVRDAEDIVGFDRKMQPWVEKVRRETGFLQFIDDTVRGRRGMDANGYFLDAKEAVALEPEITSGFGVSADTTYTSASYAIKFGATPGRWPSSRMSTSVSRPFFKNAAQNASGLVDGGVAQITSSLAAWTNDCPSAVNLNYGGTNAALKNGDDNINVVVYNDPTDAIAGPWTGSGVVATAYMSGDDTHSFDSTTWVSMSDSDVVVQNGLTGSESFLPTALTHEIGHAIGLRHSNTQANGSACTVNEECTTTAIMNSTVVGGLGYTLQNWDKTAIGAIYPGGSCVTTVTRYDHDGDGMADIFWRNTANGLNWMYKMNINAVTGLATTNEGDLNWKIVGIADFDGDNKSDILWRNDVNGINYLYKMNGNVVTGLWINQEADLNWKIVAVGDFNGDNKADIYWRNSVTGMSWIYLMNGNVISSSIGTQNEGDLNWKVVGVGDFNNDGRDDLLWRHSVSGLNWIYLMNGGTVTGRYVQGESDTNWKVAGVGDFDNDGYSDILWRHDVNGINWLYHMNADGSVTGQYVNQEGDPNWKVANVADFDGDGDADILWRNSVNGLNWMYRMSGNTITHSVSVQGEGDLNWKIQR